MTLRYGPWRGGRDPLAPPYDAADAVERLGESVLDGATPRQALRDLLRRGVEGSEGREGLRGLDDLRRRLARRRRDLERHGPLDGTLQEVRRLLDEAVEEERRALFPDPDDSARLAELTLDALPEGTAAAVQQLADYAWRSPEAAERYAQIQRLLRDELLDSTVRGLKETLAASSPQERAEALAAVRAMLDDLERLLDAHLRGEDTRALLAEFLERHGHFFPSQPQTVDELLDELARRAAAHQRLLDSLTPEQRDELDALTAQALQGEPGLSDQLGRIGDALAAARPDLAGPPARRGQPRGGAAEDDQPGLGRGAGTSLLQEVADLERLEEALRDAEGAGLDDLDEDALERALGRGAVDDLEALRRLDAALRDQGWLELDGAGGLTLTPRAVRRLGAAALRRALGPASSRGGHDAVRQGSGGEPTGASLPWRFGDDQQLDTVASVRNAVLRAGGPPGRLLPEDLAVAETEHVTSAAVALLVDLSYSMETRGAWSAAKQAALALHTLVTTRFPRDVVELIGFSDVAQVLDPRQLTTLRPQRVQGTNLQHALSLADRFFARHPRSAPVVLVVTDGEPTAHVEPDGTPHFSWPPLPETLALTLAAVDRVVRRGASLDVVMLDDEPRLVRFVQEVTRRSGGRVVHCHPADGDVGDSLGRLVVQEAAGSMRATRR